jgi:glycosyltransferase involved in cell wall biosynthesis
MRAETLFWLAAAAAFYVYVGYPLLLRLLGLLRPRPVAKRPIEPDVSLLVSAYNEGDVIEEKIRNALALDYPPDRLEIAIASDGSTDGTAAIAARLAAEDGRVRVFAYEIRRGKTAVLNETVPRLRGEIVAFSDASSMLEPTALRALVASFADPGVGAVSGVYRVRKKEEAHLGTQEDFYWRYETFLRKQEAVLGAMQGAHGSLYAIRKRLYSFPPPTTINDDWVIPGRVLSQGYRIAYEPAAVAWEEAREMGGFSRRVRIMTGNCEQLREARALLWPPRVLPLFVLASHKLGRLLVPFAMVVLIAANAALLDSPLYAWTWRLQLAFYALVLAGAIVRLRPRLLRLPYYFCMVNAAAFVGIFHALGGRRVAWKRE